MEASCCKRLLTSASDCLWTVLVTLLSFMSVFVCLIERDLETSQGLKHGSSSFKSDSVKKTNIMFKGLDAALEAFDV